MERVHQEPIGALPGQARQPGVHPGDIDGDGGVLDRPGVEEGRHQGELVIFAAVVERGVVLPGIPESAHRFELLAQLAHHRLGPGHTKAALDVRLDLRAQAEDEAPLGGLGQVPGAVGQGSRAAGKGNRHGRAIREPLGVLGDQYARHERIVQGLGAPQGIKTQRVGGFGNRRDSG